MDGGGKQAPGLPKWLVSGPPQHGGEKGGPQPLAQSRVGWEGFWMQQVHLQQGLSDLGPQGLSDLGLPACGPRSHHRRRRSWRLATWRDRWWWIGGRLLSY